MNILVAGDYCDSLRVDDAISNEDYSKLFEDIKPIIESADISIVNFEFPIVIQKGEPIAKCGPNLKGQKSAIAAIKYAGFGVCTLANNHILDQGEKCCIETKKYIEDSGIKTVGAGRNLSEASEILYRSVGEETVAIINCCEHEFSIASESSAGANPLNPVQQFYKINEAKLNANYTIEIVHGGHEHFQLPSPRMKEIYRFFIDAGADAVVNHHQHCYSGYEVYKGKPIFYGLGNLLFDHESNRNTAWNEGFMVYLCLHNNNISFTIYPYTQCNEKVGVSLIKDKRIFEEKLQELSLVISDDNKLKETHKKWMDSKSMYYRLVFEPYENRISNGLYRRGILPSFINKGKLLKIINFIFCESHFDCIKNDLNNLLKAK